MIGSTLSFGLGAKPCEDLSGLYYVGAMHSNNLGNDLFLQRCKNIRTVNSGDFVFIFIIDSISSFLKPFYLIFSPYKLYITIKMGSYGCSIPDRIENGESCLLLRDECAS